MHAVVLVSAGSVEGAVVVEDVDELEIVLLTRDEIVWVVGGSDLDGSGPEVHVDQLGVEDDGHAPPREGMHQKLAVIRLVPGRQGL